jgi:hypothetical protein
MMDLTAAYIGFVMIIAVERASLKRASVAAA